MRTNLSLSGILATPIIFGLITLSSFFIYSTAQSAVKKPKTKSKSVKAENKSKQVTICAVGDVMPGEHLNKIFKSKDPCWPFEKTLQYLKDADITFCNLECPISESNVGTKLKKSDANLLADPASVKSLTCAGVNIVSLANNHALDYDVPALERTISLLKDNGIKYVGIRDTSESRAPLIIEKNGLKIAFLAYLDGIPESFVGKSMEVFPLLLPYIQDDIYNVRKTADIIIVSFHFGKEFSTVPGVYQTQVAREAIDAGADLVLGHHPHVLQPLERYKNGVIAYSLGNFVFGCYGQAAESAIFRFKIISNKTGRKINKIEQIDAIPVNVYNNEVQFQPTPFEDKRKSQIIKFLFKDIK